MKNVSLSQHSVLLQDHMHGVSQWILFSDPIEIVLADELHMVDRCMNVLGEWTNKGYYAAGYLTYEASTGLDASLHTHCKADYPLLWFGIYKNYSEFDISNIEPEEFVLSSWEPNISDVEYEQYIQKIKEQIYCGNTYQVNFTFKLRSNFSGSPLGLASHLFKAQSSQYCAYLNLGSMHICTASPELFFDYEHGSIRARPMKGTINRGLTAEEDVVRQNWLHESIKNRAENVMIVDMIRNDLSRLSNVENVHVDELFSIERYPTVFQMTSTVVATTDSSAIDVVKKMFPCASITGAPKVSTMKIIKELESEPRGIYTGSIGYFAPDKKAQFNVAIRTVVLNLNSGMAEYGVGGGIVWDSQANDEYNECKLKAEILTYNDSKFELFETLRWDSDGGFCFLSEHITRLKNSALYFGYPFDEKRIYDQITHIKTDGAKSLRIRVLLASDGNLTLVKQNLNSMVGRKVRVSTDRMITKTKFVFHKTTNRFIYDKVMSANHHYDDVLLMNEQGNITESCIGNLVVKVSDEFFTPPVSDGLLNGIFRQILVNQHIVQERKIDPMLLAKADQVYLINSVRGWIKLKRDVDNLSFLVEDEQGLTLAHPRS